MARALRIQVEGWRDIPHSYSLVLCFQLLELAQRSHLRLSFRQVPYFSEKWRRLSPFSTAEQAVLDGIPLADDRPVDVVYRAAYPFDFSADPRGAPVLVFATSEFRKLPDGCPADLSRLKSDRVTITSPSRWSAAPFVAHGAEVVVLPHGIDPAKFHRLAPERRTTTRRSFGLQPEHFVFLNVGSMSQNKGIVPLLEAFLRLLPKHPQIRLALKGLGNLYASRTMVQEHLNGLRVSPAQRTQLLERLVFLDSCVDFAGMNELYGIGDCYIAPYFGEGFALPVIESLACELPVLVSNGGPTDDYVTDPLLRIPAQHRVMPHNGATILECGVTNIAAKMEDILSRPDAYRGATAALSTLVRERYSWTHIADQLEEALGRLAFG